MQVLRVYINLQEEMKEKTQSSSHTGWWLTAAQVGCEVCFLRRSAQGKDKAVPFTTLRLQLT